MDGETGESSAKVATAIYGRQHTVNTNGAFETSDCNTLHIEVALAPEWLDPDGLTNARRTSLLRQSRQLDSSTAEADYGRCHLRF